MIIMGIDPSFTETGWSIFQYEDGWTVIDGGCIKTKSEASKKGIKTTEDQTRRLRFISDVMADKIHEHSVSLISAEYQPGWTSKKVAKTSGMLISSIISCAMFNGDLPVEWYQPTEVKKIVLGKKSGTKKEIREVLEPDYPNLSDFYGDTKYRKEAVGDAAAVVHCAIKRSELVKALT